MTLQVRQVDGDVLIKKGLEEQLAELGYETEYVQDAYELFRAYVIDAARSGNGLTWELE